MITPTTATLSWLNWGAGITELNWQRRSLCQSQFGFVRLQLE